MNLSVNGYTTKSHEGYKLIASPITTPVNVTATGLDTGTYDLYYFDESADKEWINYKPIPHFDLEWKKGYLYATSVSNNSIAFTGPTQPTDEDVNVPLAYTSGKRLAGCNLIGNPYTCNAYVNVPFYRLNSDGDEVEQSSYTNAIAPMEGVFVEGSAATTACTFTTTTSKSNSSLNMRVSEGGKTLDRASLCFNDGANLGKFQLDPNHTKIYMPVEGKDYAVFNASNEGEMPVSFKAENNGSYTLSFTTEDAEFSYLHLIDNMTGNDVDLLATPAYSFDARTTDYASRFRLLYAKAGSNNGNDFGFVSNGNLMVLGIEGEATLQVFDVTGRMLSSETFSGSYSKAVNASTGVYMIRLIQGNDVRTQKIVVR